MKHYDFENKSVIITGASSGIGKSLALQLASEGARLILAARDLSRLETLALECNHLAGKAVAIPTDVGVESQCQMLTDEAYKAFGVIDMLVNNAGIDVVSKLEDLPDLHLFKQVLDVNFFGALYCTYYALPHLKESKGRIVNVSSLGGLLAIPYNTSYCASKSAIIGFSNSLRMELGPAGVSVTVICPAWVVTEFHERYLDKDGKPKGPAGRAIYTEKMMTAEKCAKIIIEAARNRKRQIVMPPGGMGQWLGLIAPGFTDRLIVEKFLLPAVRRTLNK
jgi:short-subunit dehydrogenase